MAGSARGRRGQHSLLSPVGFAQRRESSEQLLLVLKRVGQNHEQSADDTEVSEEEGEVEEQAVAEACKRSAWLP